MRKTLVGLTVGAAMTLAVPLATMGPAGAAGPTGVVCVSPGMPTATATAPTANAGGYVGLAQAWTVSWTLNGVTTTVSNTGPAQSAPDAIPAGALISCSVTNGWITAGSATG